jgi:hypothetical protein
MKMLMGRLLTVLLEIAHSIQMMRISQVTLNSLTAQQEKDRFLRKTTITAARISIAQQEKDRFTRTAITAARTEIA